MARTSSGVNLLSTLSKQEVVKERKKGQLALSTAGITFLVAIIAVGLMMYNSYIRFTIEGAPYDFLNISGLDGQIENVNEEIKFNEDVLRSYLEVGTKVTFVGNILNSRPDYQKILERLRDLLPDDIQIEEYIIDENGYITLSGKSKDYYTLALFISRAQKLDLVEGNFDNFKLDGAQTLVDQDDIVDFKINAEAVFPEKENATLEVFE